MEIEDIKFEIIPDRKGIYSWVILKYDGGWFNIANGGATSYEKAAAQMWLHYNKMKDQYGWE